MGLHAILRSQWSSEEGRHGMVRRRSRGTRQGMGTQLRKAWELRTGNWICQWEVSNHLRRGISAVFHNRTSSSVLHLTVPERNWGGSIQRDSSILLCGVNTLKLLGFAENVQAYDRHLPCRRHAHQCCDFILSCAGSLTVAVLIEELLHWKSPFVSYSSLPSFLAGWRETVFPEIMPWFRSV